MPHRPWEAVSGCAAWRGRRGGGRLRGSCRAGGRVEGWASACCGARACPCATPCGAAGTRACILAQSVTVGLPKPRDECGACSVVPHDLDRVCRVFPSVDLNSAAPNQDLWTAAHRLFCTFKIAMLSPVHSRKRSPATGGRCGAPTRRRSRAHCPGPVHVSPVPVHSVPPVSGVRIPLSAQGADWLRV